MKVNLTEGAKVNFLAQHPNTNVLVHSYENNDHAIGVNFPLYHSSNPGEIVVFNNSAVLYVNYVGPLDITYNAITGAVVFTDEAQLVGLDDIPDAPFQADCVIM